VLMVDSNIRSFSDYQHHDNHLRRIDSKLTAIDQKLDALSSRMRDLESREHRREMDSRLNWDFLFICLTTIAVAVTVFVLFTKA